MLHPSCRFGYLPYTPGILDWGNPLIYYPGLFGNLCVFNYCFCSGYTHYLIKKVWADYTKDIHGKSFRFLVHVQIVVLLFFTIGCLARVKPFRVLSGRFQNTYSYMGSATKKHGGLWLAYIFAFPASFVGLHK